MDDFIKKMEELNKRELKEYRESDRKILEAKAEHNRSMAKTEMVGSVIEQDHKRIQKMVDNPTTIISDIHTKFKDETKLNEKDIAFLFGATALQMLRWALLPRLDFDFKQIPKAERMTAQQGGGIEKKGIRDYLQNNGYDPSDIRELYNSGNIKKYTWERLLIAPVPYDAMIGSEKIVIDGVTDIGKNINGINHHSATWGHDPIVGWIIGPMNITSRMITFRNFDTYYVAQIGDTRRQRITKKTSMGNMLNKSINAWKDDSKKLFASVAKQGIHLKSDKYTKSGLPIPLLSPDKAQQLLVKGWNSNEVERLFSKVAKDLAIVGAQLGIAVLIDQLVKALHLMCYDEVEDGSISTYQVKTQKILCYSTGMAEIANGIYVASTGDIEKIDIGGYINFAKNLITAARIKSQIETEFLEKELSRKLYGEEYYWEVIK